MSVPDEECEVVSSHVAGLSCEHKHSGQVSLSRHHLELDRQLKVGVRVRQRRQRQVRMAAELRRRNQAI